jgi:hypothetical protein
MLILFMLLAGFVPLLQVAFIVFLEEYLSGLTRCERSGQNSEDHPLHPYHVVSDYWVDQGECVLLIADLQIVLAQEIYRSYWLQIGFDRKSRLDFKSDWRVVC